MTGKLKKYVSYVKDTVNAGATPGTFSAKFGSASTANVVPMELLQMLLQNPPFQIPLFGWGFTELKAEAVSLVKWFGI